MKNALSSSAIARIAASLDQLLPGFSSEQFRVQAQQGIDQLELKQRVEHLIEIMAQHLPQDFCESAMLLSKVKDVWVMGDKNDPLQSFAAWPIVDYVAKYGLEHPDISLPLLKYLTGLFSAEFAVRPFIVKYPQLCQQYFTQWVESGDEHVRRLVSEGTRPKLPWGMQLRSFVKSPQVNIPLLQRLKDDPSLYVRRSVANHLNDIAKDHPQLVIDTCQRWLKGASSEVQWIIKHATRTLVKNGHPDVYPLLGYTSLPQCKVTNLTLSNSVIQLGEAINFSVTVQSCADQQQAMVLDFALALVKANGQQKNKVFKFKNLQLAAGEQVTLHKQHYIKAISTRRYYCGTQRLIILINGESVAEQDFELCID